MIVYISARGLRRNEAAVTKIIECIQAVKPSPESVVVMIALRNTKLRDKDLIIGKMADIILRINAPVTIINVFRNEELCDLVRAQTLCATQDPFLKRIMTLRHID